MTPQTIFIAVTLFQIKHLVADFILQTGRMVTEKGHYGQFGGVQHAGMHALLTAPILVWLGVGPWMIAGILLAEFAVHYHIDWVKATHARRTGLQPSAKLYWIALGLDQMLHQLTYIAILVAVVLLPAG